MHEHETIVVLEALMKWEDKLVGQKFTLVTDHKGLDYFKTQLILSPRQDKSIPEDNAMIVNKPASIVAESSDKWCKTKVFMSQ